MTTTPNLYNNEGAARARKRHGIEPPKILGEAEGFPLNSGLALGRLRALAKFGTEEQRRDSRATLAARRVHVPEPGNDAA